MGNSVWVDFLSTMIQITIDSQSILGVQDSSILDRILENEIISSFVYKKLKYIKKTIAIKFFYQKLVNNTHELFSNVIQPMSTSRIQERSNIEYFT